MVEIEFLSICQGNAPFFVFDGEILHQRKNLNTVSFNPTRKGAEDGLRWTYRRRLLLLILSSMSHQVHLGTSNVRWKSIHMHLNTSSHLYIYIIIYIYICNDNSSFEKSMLGPKTTLLFGYQVLVLVVFGKNSSHYSQEV